MTTHPLVSIFMPCYNQENFIADAIQTCIDQNYENFEIIIVDDHSTDSTWEIVKSIYNQYPRLLRISRNPRNLGITPTCNQILKKCRGKYICFTAGDEIYLPDKISKQVELMECSSMMALSYHDVEVFDSATNEPMRYWNHGEASATAITGSANFIVRKLLEEGTSFMSALSIMVKRKYVPASGFDNRVPVASDWLMWIEILVAAGEEGIVGFIPETLARHRRHGNNISGEGYRHTADELVTLSIVEDKYPEFVINVNRGLAQIRYRYAVKNIQYGKLKTGRDLMFLSIRNRWLTIRSIYWIASTYLKFIPKDKRELNSFKKRLKSLFKL